MNIKPIVFLIVVILIIFMYLHSTYIPRGNRIFETIKSKISHNLNFLVPKTFTTVEENKKKLPRFKASKAKILNGKISGYIALGPSAKEMMKNEKVIERASSNSVLDLGHVDHKGTPRLGQSMTDTKCLFRSARIVPTADHFYCNYFPLSFLSSFPPFLLGLHIRFRNDVFLPQKLQISSSTGLRRRRHWQKINTYEIFLSKHF